MPQTEILKGLSESEFFDNLESSDIEKIAEKCEMRTYNEGEAVFSQGDLGRNLYIIVEGQVFLERSVNLGARKGSVTIEALGKGRVLGCWSTLLGQAHCLMSSAVCKNSTKIIVIKGEALRKLMMEDMVLGFHIMEKFCFLLRDRIQSAYGAMEKI